MAEWRLPLESYKGRIREVVIGKGDRAVKIGGENVLAFNQAFDEGEWPNPPRLAVEIWDMEPEGWSKGLLDFYGDVVKDPARWAEKVAQELKPDLIFLYMLSTDPNEKDTPSEQAAEVAKAVYEAAGLPLVVYCTGNESKDPQVLGKVAEALGGENLLLGPAIKENYEPIAQAANEHGHCLTSQAPIDINLQKEMNVKLTRVLPPDRVVLDPLAPVLGVGLEFGFSIFERQKQAAISFGDEMMQMPMMANFSFEVWKTKEAKGDEEMGVMWEVLTAMAYLEAGANLLVVRHPESYRRIKEVIEAYK